MRLTLLVVLLAAPCVLAQFSFLTPPGRGYSQTTYMQSPCGGYNSAITAVSFSITGSTTITLLVTGGTGNLTFYYASGSNSASANFVSTNYAITLKDSTVNATDFPVEDLALPSNAVIGQSGILQGVFYASTGVYYQCLDVLVTAAATPSPTNSAFATLQNPNTDVIVGGIIGGSSGLIVLLLLFWFFISRYCRRSHEKRVIDHSLGYEKPHVLDVSLTKIRSKSQLPDKKKAKSFFSAQSNTATDIHIPFESLKLGKVLGQGQFGLVYQADYTGAQVAVKKIKGVDKQLMLQEATIIKNIPPHPNVLHYFGISQDNGEFMMVTELCDRGNLAHYLRDPSNTLSSQQCRELCRQIASGMWHISKYGIIHRDLRAENILLRGATLEAKVADFGLARSLHNANEENNSSYYRMTELKPIPVAWTPPEVLSQTDQLKYVAESDVWSFGVAMWEIYSQGAKPFERMDIQVVIAIIRDQDRTTSLLPRPDNCPDDVFAMMQSCWAFNPQDRPTFEKLHNQLA